MHTLHTQAVDAVKLAELTAQCEAEFDATTLFPGGYPGITLRNAAVATYLAEFVPASVEFDFSYGTGANYVYTKQGQFIGLHSDKPLYELDASYHVKPEFENRVCMHSVIACLSGTATIRITPYENVHEDVELVAGDVLTLDGGEVHELLPVQGDLATFACGFFCTDAA